LLPTVWIAEALIRGFLEASSEKPHRRCALGSRLLTEPASVYWTDARKWHRPNSICWAEPWRDHQAYRRTLRAKVDLAMIGELR
jgi:hypothetical protein